jgi:hypothetical protein
VRFGFFQAVAAMLCLTIVGSWVDPGTAPANPGPAAYPEPLELQASNGYSLMAWGIPAWKGRSSQLLLTVSRPGASVAYTVPAEVTAESIQADLGVLGAIDVSSRSSGRTKTEKPACGRRPIEFEPDVFEGRIDFRGEGGYTEVHATSAEGDIRFLGEMLCPAIAGPSGSGPHLPGAGIAVGPNRLRPGEFRFEAHKNHPLTHSFFFASVAERRGALRIERSVSAVGRSAAFEYEPTLRVAMVEPPAPFTGSAAFHRDAIPPNRWSGSLAVDFPGRSAVHLTGDLQHVGLIRGEWDSSSH